MAIDLAGHACMRGIDARGPGTRVTIDHDPGCGIESKRGYICSWPRPVELAQILLRVVFDVATEKRFALHEDGMLRCRGPLFPPYRSQCIAGESAQLGRLLQL